MRRVRKDGEEYQSANGYWYIRINGKWRLKHHVIAEKNLGRSLRNTEGVYFADGDRNNLDPSNVRIRQRGAGKVRSRLAVIEDRIRELEAEREELLKQL